MTPATARFSTSRQIRTLATQIRDFAYVDGPFDDVGKTSAEEVRAWLERLLQDDPKHYLAHDWNKAGPAVQDRLFTEWEHLRGRTVEEKAASMAERSNARTVAANPLFAAMGALDEVARTVTPEQMLASLNERRRQSDERRAQPTVEERAKARQDPEAPYNGALSLNHARIWRHLHRFGPPPDLAGARTELATIYPDTARRSDALESIWSWADARQCDPDHKIGRYFSAAREALRYLRKGSHVRTTDTGK